MGRDSESGSCGGRFVLCIERVSHHVTFAEGAGGDGRYFTPTLLPQADSAHLAVVLSGYRVRYRAVAYDGEPTSSVVLRRRISSFRRQLGACCLRPAGVDRVSAVDGFDRGAVLSDLATAGEEARTARSDRIGDRDIFARNCVPHRVCSRGCQWRLHLLRQHGTM